MSRQLILVPLVTAGVLGPSWEALAQRRAGYRAGGVAVGPAGSPRGPSVRRQGERGAAPSSLPAGPRCSTGRPAEPPPALSAAYGPVESGAPR